MSKELVISANRHETKVALIEDDQLVEVYFQRANEYSLAGSIHKGRVTRVLPGMQSAFVDLGLERDTFLYVSDFLEEHEDIDRVTGEERPARPRAEDQRADRERSERERPERSRSEAASPSVSGETSPPPEASAAVVTPRPVEPRVSDRGPAGTPERSAEKSDDPRDRGGRRRGRRRRNRGRGFPESKYAGEGDTKADVEESATPEASVPQAAEPETQEDVIVLPGESLRKYSRAGAGAERRDIPEPEHMGDPAVSHEHTDAEEMTEAHDAEEVAIDPALRKEASAEHEEFDATAAYASGNAAPELNGHAGLGAQELHSAAAEEETAAREEAAPPRSISAREFASGSDYEEDRDIQEMILDELGDEAMEAAEAADAAMAEAAAMLAQEPGSDAVPPEMEEGEEEPEEAGGAAPSGSAIAEGGSAEVRERGGRYPHRVSRRSRRKIRGQGAPGVQGRPEGPREEHSRPEERVPRTQDPRAVAKAGQPSISDLLKEGQEIIVQIAKEPLGQKGARITSHIALPGRYVVYMPTLEHMGVSRKIASDEERLRLKRILQASKPGATGGFITRTAAEGRTEEEISADMAFLYNLWQDIRHKADQRPAPVLLHHDLDIVQRILRDQLADTFKSIWIDNEEVYESVLRFVERFQPVLVGKVKLYTREAPIFDAFSVTQELEKALRPKVWLKSGGYIVINQTEALVAVDVNTGKYVGKSNRLEDTIVKTNTEAIKEIVRQIRLRDLGGIIVIDFIDMDERKNRQKVMAVLEETMRADRAPYKILQFNDFGLVAITRKRVKQSLERTLCSPCPHCEGAGYIKSVQTVVSEILTEARKVSGSVESKDVVLRVHPDVAKVLKSHQNKYLEELEETLRRPVLVKSDPLLHHEKFDLA